jgi:hypothetical protein
MLRQVSDWNQAVNQVWDQINDQVSYQVSNQVWNQVRNQVSNHVWHKVWSHVWNQVSNQVSYHVWHKVRDQVRDMVESVVLRQVLYSQQDAHLFVYYSYMMQVLRVEAPKQLVPYMLLAQEVNWWFPSNLPTPAKTLASLSKIMKNTERLLAISTGPFWPAIASGGAP